MDPFAEKDLIDNLRKISSSLEGIKTELSDLNVAVRELTAAQIGEELEGDSLNGAVVEFTSDDSDDDIEDDEEDEGEKEGL